MKILIAEQQPRVRYALRVLLEQQGWSITGEATDSLELIEVLKILEADVLLLDMHLPGTPAVILIAQIKAEHPSLRVVAMGSNLDLSRMSAELGSDGYISKTNQPEKIIELLCVFDPVCDDSILED